MEDFQRNDRIFQCGSGHVICGACKAQPQIRNCPTCRGPFTGRNHAYEQIISDIA